MKRSERDARALQALTGIPTSLLDEQGCGQAGCACCQVLSRVMPEKRLCEKLHQKAAEFSRSLGETYLFLCHSGLFHAVCPCAEGGFVLAGPFGLGESEPWQIPERIDGTPLGPGDVREMREAQGRMRSLEPKEAGELCTLLYDLFSGKDDSSPDDARRRALQQQRIAEALQAHKQQENSVMRYPIEKEDELMRYVREGDSRRADAVLNDLLGYAFFSSFTVEDVRVCTAELCAMLSRAAIEGGAGSDEAIAQNRSLMRSLWQAESIEDICYFMQEAVERFSETAFSRRRTGEQECVQRAIRYIHMHYSEPLTLSRLAQEAHLSESYFSTLFKKGCGYGFREYLAKVRVDRAMELLEKTNLGVTEIAQATGFDSQSYFSKVFRQRRGLSPSEYRRSANLQDAK
ncbi:MAG: helix-turn-helix domain-containing protein [Eubacteriales bacterium]|nr:helix-turn-helix domain-containing protein [Eubacteriales bacterium]